MGRSDATLNRQGVRIGTSEIYRSVEKLPEIADSLVVDIEQFGGHSKMILFVVPAPATALDDALKAKIARTLRTDFSPAMCPTKSWPYRKFPIRSAEKKWNCLLKKYSWENP